MSATNPTYRRSPEVVAAQLGSKSFLLHINDWVYLELNETAGVLWSLLEDESTIESITEKVLEKFEGEPGVCFYESLEFLEYLEQKHFIVAE